MGECKGLVRFPCFKPFFCTACHLSSTQTSLVVNDERAMPAESVDLSPLSRRYALRFGCSVIPPNEIGNMLRVVLNMLDSGSASRLLRGLRYPLDSP